jgi:hypothetical protein
VPEEDSCSIALPLAGCVSSRPKALAPAAREILKSQCPSVFGIERNCIEDF